MEEPFLPACLCRLNPRSDFCKPIELDKREFVIGRAMDANFCILDRGLSRHQAAFQCHGDHWTIKSLGLNSVRVNGLQLRKKQSVQLNHLDIVVLADGSVYKYVFKVHSSNAVQPEGKKPRLDQWELQNMCEALDKHNNLLKETLEEMVKLRELKSQMTSELAELKGQLDAKDKEFTEFQNQAAANSEMLDSRVTKVRDDTLKMFEAILEKELSCTVCTELIISATSLSCMHTFCEYCIETWRSNRLVCPLCRLPITFWKKNPIIDNVIDGIVDNLSEEAQNKRRELQARRNAGL